MDGITLGRWKRFGKDRVYANAADGTRLGFRDLTADEVVLEAGAPPEVADALRAWTEGGAPASAPVPEASPATASGDDAASAPATPSAEDWVDLAAHAPGELTRARAKAEWEREKRVGTVFAVMARAVNVHTDERAWRKGAEGEERVGPVLDRLAKRGWRTLHSIPVGENSDIDHLAIGPGGVVLVNTKHHPGAKITITKYGVTINGSKTEHVKQVREQAKRAHTLLNASGAQVDTVLPCVAIYNGGMLAPDTTIAGKPSGVLVVTNWNIGTNLKRLDPVLSESDVDRIFEIARRSTTWTRRTR